MQFLYPKFLWALFALIIPIIIHFFNFRRYTTVYFSNVAFLQNIKKETKSRSKLKNLLILLARMLALAFLIMVFAQPYIPHKKHLKIAEIPHVAIYIDNSYSMDAEGKQGVLIESAKIKAKEITELFSPNTKYLLLTNDFLQMHQRFVSSEQLIEWISQIKSTHIVRSQNDVVNKIAGLLPSADTLTMHSVFILSDFQKNTIDNSQIKVNDNLKIFAVPFTNQTQSNLYIDSVWFETPGHYKGKQETLHVKIKNSSDKSFVEIPLQLFINDTLKTSVIFNIKSQSVHEVEIPFTIWNWGAFKASVSISDYPITFDNTLYFNFTIDDIKNILIINQKASYSYFEALYKDDENLKQVTVTHNNIPYTKFNNYQTIILNEADNISSGLINQIVTYTQNGGTFVFIPSIDGNIQSYNELMSKLGSIKLDSFTQQKGSITNVDLKNILFESAFNNGLKDANLPEYKGFFRINTLQHSAVNTIFKAESGNSLFIHSTFKKGQFYVSALPLNSEITNLATHPLFVPLFYNIALYSSLPNNIYYFITSQMFVKLYSKSTNIDKFSMIENITGKELMPKYHLSMQNMLIYPNVNDIIAGHYSVIVQNKFQDYVSFNFDRAESELTYYSLNEVVDLYKSTGNIDVSIIKPNGNKMQKSIKQQSNGKPLSTLFLWFTLLFFISEMLLLRFLK